MRLEVLIIKITWIKSDFRLIFLNKSNQAELHTYIYLYVFFFVISIFRLQEKRQKHKTKEKKLMDAMISNIHTICHE